jgi:hypothetical protein
LQQFWPEAQQLAAPAHWAQEEQTFWLGAAAKVKVEAATVSARATMQNAACNLDFIFISSRFVGAEAWLREPAQAAGIIRREKWAGLRSKS